MTTYNGDPSINPADIPNTNSGSFIYEYDLVNGGTGHFTIADPILASSYPDGHYAFTWGSGCSVKDLGTCLQGVGTEVDVYIVNSLFYSSYPSASPSVSPSISPSGPPPGALKYWNGSDWIS